MIISPEIKELSNSFPKIWNNSKVPHRERKRLVRLLIEDVTLVKDQEVNIHIRFKGGTNCTISLSKPKNSWQLKQTSSDVISLINTLLENYTDGKIAEQLNTKGLTSGWGCSFSSRIIAQLRKRYHLKNRYERLRDRGLFNVQELAKLLNVKPSTIKIWRQTGIITGVAYNDKGDFLYEYSKDNQPVKGKWKKRNKSHAKILADCSMEVQYAT